MCFSATASFSASVIIGAIGVATFRSCKTRDQQFLGVVPFLFALQQVAEGFVWLSFTHNAFQSFQPLCTLSFLFLAWVVWPVLIPLAFYRLEAEGPRKQFCRKLVYVGMASALYALFNMLMKAPAPNIATFHIIYAVQKRYHHELFFFPHQTAYVLSTVVPMFLSSLKGVKVLAIANFIALVVCFWFFQYALPSTWCFFAAFLSSIIYWIINNNKPLS